MNLQVVPQHLALIKVTGLEGIVTSVTFDLFGCVQMLIDPGLDKEGKPRERYWYDSNRLKKLSKAPVMPQPNYPASTQYEAGVDKGGQELPMR